MTPSIGRFFTPKGLHFEAQDKRSAVLGGVNHHHPTPTGLHKDSLGVAGDFYWQEGHGTFKAIPDRLPALRRYIATQEEHHKKESFRDEYRRLLKAYPVDYDERYVWD